MAGRFNHSSGKFSYAIIHRVAGLILGLDLGQAHINRDGRAVGEIHRNDWQSGFRDKCAHLPRDITYPWNQPVNVWAQFCAVANREHRGIMHPPPVPGVPIR